MNLRFQPAGHSDIDALFELSKTLIDRYEDLSSIDLDEVLPWVRRKLLKKLPEYRAVYLNDEKVGFFRLFESDGNVLELDDLYVLSPHQGQGIGSEIIRYCISESNKHEKPLTLYVFTKNTGAIRLYERFGFRIRETVSPTRIIMERLPDSAE